MGGEPGVKEIQVRVLPAAVANAFVAKHHYSGRFVRNSQLHLGAFLNGRLHGVMQFGPPFDKRKVIGLVRDTKWNEMLELNRMAFDSYLPKNSESRCLAIAFRLIRKNAPHVKWILSFSDGTQSGDGTIYRATGFALTGINRNKSIIRLPDGTVAAKMTFTKGKHILGQNGKAAPPLAPSSWTASSCATSSCSTLLLQLRCPSSRTAPLGKLGRECTWAPSVRSAVVARLSSREQEAVRFRPGRTTHQMAKPAPEKPNKKAEYETYRLWEGIPAVYKEQMAKKPEEFAASMGITDELLLELLAIRTKAQFAEKYRVHPDTLTRWEAKLEKEGERFEGVREMMRKLTPNVMGSHYNSLLKRFNPLTGKLWYQVAEKFAEKTDSSVSVRGVAEMLKEALATGNGRNDAGTTA